MPTRRTARPAPLPLAAGSRPGFARPEVPRATTIRQLPTAEPHEQRKAFPDLADFYPFYLSEHANQVSRRLHFVGTSIALGLLVAALFTRAWWLVAVALVQGYACAWIGHFFFEHNKPATFKYPRFSFMGDWRLWWDIVTGKIPYWRGHECCRQARTPLARGTAVLIDPRLFLLVHVLLSLRALFAGLVAVGGFLAGIHFQRGVCLFLATPVLTSLTGFGCT